MSTPPATCATPTRGFLGALGFLGGAAAAAGAPLVAPAAAVLLLEAGASSSLSPSVERRCRCCCFGSPSTVRCAKLPPKRAAGAPDAAAALVSFSRCAIAAYARSNSANTPLLPAAPPLALPPLPLAAASLPLASVRRLRSSLALPTLRFGCGSLGVVSFVRWLSGWVGWLVDEIQVGLSRDVKRQPNHRSPDIACHPGAPKTAMSQTTHVSQLPGLAGVMNCMVLWGLGELRCVVCAAGAADGALAEGKGTVLANERSAAVHRPTQACCIHYNTQDAAHSLHVLLAEANELVSPCLPPCCVQPDQDGGVIVLKYLV